MSAKPPHLLLATAAKAHNLSQADIARACRCGTGTVANWFVGRRKPGVGYALALKDLLGLDPTVWAVAPRTRRSPPRRPQVEGAAA